MIRNLLACLCLFLFFQGYSQKEPNNKERLAIMNFSIIGNDEDVKNFEWLGLGFSESLSDAFSRVPRFSIVERTQLDKILNEQKLQKTNQIDSSSVIKAGKILGVKLILIGSCQVYTGHMLVNMRMVNVETGEISPINNFPVIEPLENVLQIQKKICLAVLKQFNITNNEFEIKEIEAVTNSSTKNFKAYEFFTKGINLYDNGQYDEALDMFGLALMSDKKYSKAYYKRGLTNYALAKYDNAVSDFENSINYIKKDSVYFLMGNAYQKKGEPKKAYEYYKKANKSNPANQAIKSLIFEYENKPIELKEGQIINGLETIYEFKNGIARIKSNNKFGFVDTANKIVIPIVFDDLSDFNKGLARAKYNSKWGFIDSKGKFVVQPQYNEVSEFDEHNLARVVIKDKWGIIDRTGKIILPIEFVIEYYYSRWRSDDLMVVAKYKNILAIDYIHGVYDINGKQILPIIYDDIDIIELKDKDYNKIEYPYIHASLDGKWGVVNRQNDIIVPFKYSDRDCIKPFKNGFAAVKVNERWGFVDEKGIEVITPKYERVEDYMFGFFIVKQKEKWGAIDSKNKEMIPCIYNKLEILEKNYFAAKKDSLWGIIDSSNNVICEALYTSMGSEITRWSIYESENFKKHLLRVPVKKEGKLFWINEKCKCIYDCKQ